MSVLMVLAVVLVAAAGPDHTILETSAREVPAAHSASLNREDARGDSLNSLDVVRRWPEVDEARLASPLTARVRVTAGFSARRLHPILKVYRPHHGVDVAADLGDPVRAAAAGVVTFVGRKGEAGNMVRLRHSDTLETAYLHLSHIAVGLVIGDEVTRGETIGLVGATGLVTGPHLEFRVRSSGKWVDPLPFLQGNNRRTP